MKAKVMKVLVWLYLNVLPRVVWGTTAGFSNEYYSPGKSEEGTPLRLKFYGFAFKWGVLGVVRKSLAEDVKDWENELISLVDRARAKDGYTPLQFRGRESIVDVGVDEGR